MKNIKIYILLIVCLLIGVMMVGCGSNGAANVNVDEVSAGSEVNVEDEKDDPPIEAPAQTQDEVKSEEESESNFRNSSWGDSKDTIKNNESNLELTEDDDLGLTYNGEKLVDLEVLTSYYIDRDYGLYRGLYYVTEKHSNVNSYVNDYYTLQDALMKKYGKEYDEQMLWNDDSYKDDPNNYGIAVATGNLLFYTKWEIDGTEIMLALQGDNYSPQLIIGYTDLDYEFKDDLSGL